MSVEKRSNVCNNYSSFVTFLFIRSPHLLYRQNTHNCVATPQFSDGDLWRYSCPINR